MFKKGDWIIATNGYNGNWLWSTSALEVIDVTSYHLIYVCYYSPEHHIMTMDDVIRFGFILAEPSIIEATKKMRNWPITVDPDPISLKPKKKINKTFECWVNYYGKGNVCAHESLETADYCARTNQYRITGKAFHFVGQYTVEE